MIWNDSLIYSYLCDIRSRDVALNFQPSKLDEIIEKVISDSKLFYEQVACLLSKEEYEYLKDKVEIKNCKNCTNSCSDVVDKYFCERWSNDELIGKEKVKKIY